MPRLRARMARAEKPGTFAACGARSVNYASALPSRRSCVFSSVPSNSPFCLFLDYYTPAESDVLNREPTPIYSRRRSTAFWGRPCPTCPLGNGFRRSGRNFSRDLKASAASRPVRTRQRYSSGECLVLAQSIGRMPPSRRSVGAWGRKEIE